MGRINYGASALFHSPTHVIDRGANDVWLGVRIRIFNSVSNENPVEYFLE